MNLWLKQQFVSANSGGKQSFNYYSIYLFKEQRENQFQLIRLSGRIRSLNQRLCRNL